MIPFCILKAQYQAIQTQVNSRINAVLDHGQYIMGPEVAELEEKLERFTGAKYCITVASGTDALVISLMALGLQAGDEVITSPFSFAATSEAIVLLGGKPVFVDIDSDTCNINASLIEAKITDKTKAIMPVSLYGQPADMDEINAIAKKYGNIPVIEDGAQSFGAIYKNKRSCNLSTIGCTSFFPSKPLGCYGDGGAIFTSNEQIAQACREIRVHGQSQRYLHTRIGIGGRMDTLQCAILLAKLPYFESELVKRERLRLFFNEELKGVTGTLLLKEDRTTVSAQYTLFEPKRDQLASYLQKFGIPTAIHYPKPLHAQPAYKKYADTDLQCSEEVAKNVISIPFSAYISEDEKIFLIEKLKSFLYSVR